MYRAVVKENKVSSYIKKYFYCKTITVYTSLLQSYINARIVQIGNNSYNNNNAEMPL